MKVCIFGAGAIGGYLGVQLSRGGIDVSLVARGAHLAAMRSNGVRLHIDGAERVARLPCTDDPAELGIQDADHYAEGAFDTGRGRIDAAAHRP